MDPILEWLNGALSSYIKAYSMVQEEVMAQLGTIRIETIQGLVEWRQRQLEEVEVNDNSKL